MRLVLISIVFIISSISTLMNNKNVNSAKTQQGLGIDSMDLPIYKIDSCIINIISNTLSKDSLCNYYRKGLTAYNFSIIKQSDFYAIEIRPIYLDRLKQIDYFGAFKVNNRFFLCWGTRQYELFSKEPLDSFIIKLNEGENDDLYLGGDVPSKKELVTCKGLKLLFVITAYCN
jgi:hypothetical protein